MAVRNAAPTLEKACHSLLAQTLLPKEILLILNGCNDQTPQIATALQQTHSQIRILNSPPEGGVALAARLGCQEAQSPLLARMDADDVAHPQKLEHQVAKLIETNADLVTSHIKTENSLGAGLERFVHWANTLHLPQDFLHQRFIESPVIQPGVLMTKKAYSAVGGYQVQEGPEDYDLWLRLLENKARFFQAPNAILHWHDSPTRLTRSHSDYSEARMTATKAQYLARLEQVQNHGVVLAGTGPIGRRLGKFLQQQNITLKAFFDVAPQKIGKTCLGLPILGPQDFGVAHRQAILLGCVGRGKREQVRKLAQEIGYQEGLDFFACC